MQTLRMQIKITYLGVYLLLEFLKCSFSKPRYHQNDTGYRHINEYYNLHCLLERHHICTSDNNKTYCEFQTLHGTVNVLDGFFNFITRLSS